MANIFIALGSNLSGPWGTPFDTLCRALEKLESFHISIVASSRAYYTKAHSATPQADFFNVVIAVSTPISAIALLRILKQIERQAGRRPITRNYSGRWMPRPLDLDIICYRRVISNWQNGHPKLDSYLVLPHGRAHERAFVLQPLSEVAPHWHHPVHGLTAAALLKRPKARGTGAIIAVRDVLRRAIPSKNF